MTWRLWFLFCFCSALLGVPATGAADDASDRALAVLYSKGWGGCGGVDVVSFPDGTNRTEVSSQFLRCESKAYFFIAAVEHSIEPTTTGPLADGAFRARDHQVIRWSCETLDGKTGTVEIGDRRYRLEDGAAFWLFRKGEGWQVYQMKVERGLLQRASESQFAGAPFTVLEAGAKNDTALQEHMRSLLQIAD